MKNGAKNRALMTLRAEKLAINSLQKSIDKDFEEAVALLSSRIGNIVVTGIGKSGFVAGKIAATFTSLGHKATYLHPVEALHGDVGVVSEGDVVVAISYSGESIEIINLIKHLKTHFNVMVISITKNKKNSIAKLSNKALSFSIKNEGCPIGVAPMASTTGCLVMGDLLASALTKPKEFKPKHFVRFHPGGGLALKLTKVKDVMIKGKDLPLSKETANLNVALENLNNKKRGITGIVNKGGKLVGVLTDGDIRRIVLKNALKEPLNKLMTKNPKFIYENNTLDDALELMEKHRITALFVLNKNNKPQGLIHIHDILGGQI